MRKLKIWLKIIWHFFNSINCNKKAKLLDASQTIDRIIKYQISLIRLGDGEQNIIEGMDIHYQKALPKLSEELQNIIRDYKNEGINCGYLLCMPNEFLKCSGLKLMKKRVWISSWSKFRYVFKHKYDIIGEYGEAFLFAKKYDYLYSKIWENKKLVIFVHNNKHYSDVFSDRYNKSVLFIPVSSKDCYDDVDIITDKIKCQIDNIGFAKKDLIVLISAGPCAKTIVYRLRNCGVQIIDTGHCWDEPLALMR